ncbi:MAG: flagellar type III secretion system pore protein FliP [Deltaproteobacteria bacterium]|nr:flagellar type III secretion system pore protein FliP [Deltaproteobacteria bacterium]
MNSSMLSLLGGTIKGTELASVIEILFLLTVLSIGPIILITLTSFTRIVVVLSFLRQALGTQQSPPNQIIIALSLFLSLYVMAPVWQRIEAVSVAPYLQRTIGPQEALEQAWLPLREFLLRQTRKADLGLFLRLRGEMQKKETEAPATVLIPAFMISELKTAFQIAFLIYVPFLILDLVVASIVMSMGMMFLPPVLISLPLKLALFVLVDGWNLLVDSIIRGFK